MSGFFSLNFFKKYFFRSINKKVEKSIKFSKSWKFSKIEKFAKKIFVSVEKQKSWFWGNVRNCQELKYFLSVGSFQAGNYAPDHVFQLPVVSEMNLLQDFRVTLVRSLPMWKWCFGANILKGEYLGGQADFFEKVFFCFSTKIIRSLWKRFGVQTRLRRCAGARNVYEILSGTHNLFVLPK